MHRNTHPAPPRQTPGRLRRAGDAGAVVFLLLFLLLIILRGLVIYQETLEFAKCPSCMALTAMQQDSSLLAVMLAFAGFACLTRRYWLQLPWLLFGAASLLIFAVDIIVTKTLVQRLYVFDIFKFGKEVSGILKFAGVFITTPAGKFALAAAVVAAVALIGALLPRSRRPGLAARYFAVAAALALFGLWKPQTLRYIRYDLMQNLIVANLGFGADQPYSHEYAERMAKEYKPPEEICAPGQALRPDVIILAVESLSMHQSLLFGGARDLTPHLDALARSRTWFPDFIANGFTTDGGLIALVTGQAPIPVVGRYQSMDAFAGFNDPRGALPELLRPAGYSSHFFTTGDLSFLDKPRWLKALHFDSWEGAEQPFYNGWKRRHFNAAEDKALYQRFLQWLDQRPHGQPPFMAVLLTVSTHPPFIDPRAEKPDEEGAFRYADEQIGLFYAELEKRGFFKNGILLISGDHRSMTPLLAAEQKRFGDSAMARTPFVMATDLPLARGEVAGLFQQSDIAPSLADLTGAQACHTAGQGLFLRARPVPAAYALNARGDRRSEVSVFFDHQQAAIVLDGDRSRWSGPKPPDWQEIFNRVMFDRIRRGVSQESMVDFMVNLRTQQKPAAQP